MSIAAQVGFLEAADEARLGRPKVRPDLKIVVDIHRVVQSLLGLVLLIVLVGMMANFFVYHVAPSPRHPLARLMFRFDLGFEPSIPSWYSTGALFAASVLLSLITLAKWRSRDRFRVYWLVLAAGFFAMSIDEGVRFHEMINTALVMLKLKGPGLLFFPWLVPASLLVATVGLSYVPFLRHLDSRTRILFLSAGAVYVIGGVGIDAIGAMIVEQRGIQSIYHTLTVTVEELLEMSGVLLFIYALLEYIRGQFGSIQFFLTSVGTPR